MDTVINDVFSKYQVRKSKKQKTEFIKYATQIAKDCGYSSSIENGVLGVRNIVVGNPDSAKVIYTAHYDTCARLPFPNFLTPKNFAIYLLFSLAVGLVFFCIAFLLGFVTGSICGALGLEDYVATSVAQVLYFGLLALMFFGPANKHTANDNTSGITVLFGIMKALPKDQKEKVAFIFFDQEEMGMFGSGSFAKKHKNIKNNTLLINFDCVSDGKDIMILAKKEAQQYSDLLKNSYKSNGDVEVDVTNKAFYPSDQSKFKKGVGVAAFKKTKGGMLYINRIHTNKDTVYRRENINFLVSGSVKIIEQV